MPDSIPSLSFNRRSLNISPGNAICYSGYRDGQSPQTSIYPSYDEIREDLLLLAPNWHFLRLYDCSLHAECVLQVIRQEGLEFKVMLGINLEAEISNPQCPWGAHFNDKTLLINRETNDQEVNRAIDLANQHPDSVFSVSIGNEAAVEWTDHLVTVDRLIIHALRLRARISQPVTFCENYVPWADKLSPLAAELDFISVHTYPVWEYKSIDEAIAYSQQNYYAVAERYPNHPVVITEAGWPSASNGRGIEVPNASPALQAEYCAQLHAWTSRGKILTFVFEAFDESWKGSDDPLEPEKHWGIFHRDRTPKPVVSRLFSNNLPLTSP
jgi:exo-beta-1,3-glucanase (GH17 family)